MNPGLAPWADQNLFQPPGLDTLSLTQRITENEVTKALRTAPNRSAPGHDRLTYIDYKLSNVVKILTSIFNTCLANCKIPIDWKHAIIKLIPKSGTDNIDLSEWRPISKLVTIYKTFMMIIGKRVIPWIVDSNRLSCKQKGSLPRNGLQEHVFCLNSAITDFKHQSGKMYIMFLDLADAFGSIDHEIMIDALHSYGYPDILVNLTRNIYNSSTFQIETKNGLTVPILRQRGIIQGCPFSVVAFEQGIDIWLRWLHNNSAVLSIPNQVQGYVDDIVLATTDEALMTEMGTKTDSFLNYSGMQVKHRKCAILHGQRVGNNWNKRDRTDTIHIEIQGKEIPKIGKSGKYQYLGHDFSLDGKANHSQVTDIINSLVQTLCKISNSVLPVVAKVEAINMMVMSKLNFYLCNVSIPISTLKTLEDKIVSLIRNWFGLNKSSNRDIMFIPKKYGGLGIRDPTPLYIAKKISFLLSVLNSDDPQTQHCARSSLNMHMLKRKATRVDDDQGNANFAGFMVDEHGRVIKGSKVNWPKSIWIELNELCMREDLSLEVSADTYAIVSTIDPEVSLVLRNHAAVFNHIKTKHINSRIARFKTKVSQGRVLNTPCIDLQLSNNFLHNNNITDNLVKFIYKSRLQLLECNSLLHLYYPRDYSKSCPLCNNPFDTVSHILNGCMNFQNMYIRRHDRIVNHIHQQITNIRSDLTVYNNRIITAEMLNSDSQGLYHTILHKKPDLLIIDHCNNKVFIVEISTPFDAFIDQCYQTKFDYYQPLCELITVDTNYTCKIVVLIIGSTGCVHNKVVTGLKMLGMSTHRSKAIAKYISLSAAIGSNIVWQMRVRAAANVR